jgi:microcystin degradation protein MlrC
LILSRALPGGGVSADLFGQGDDDACGAAEIAEPVDALVLGHLANKFGAVGAQAVDGVVDVVDGEHHAMQAQRVGRSVLWLGS